MCDICDDVTQGTISNHTQNIGVWSSALSTQPHSTSSPTCCSGSHVSCMVWHACCLRASMLLAGVRLKLLAGSQLTQKPPILIACPLRHESGLSRVLLCSCLCGLRECTHGCTCIVHLRLHAHSYIYLPNGGSGGVRARACMQHRISCCCSREGVCTRFNRAILTAVLAASTLHCQAWNTFWSTRRLHSNANTCNTWWH